MSGDADTTTPTIAKPRSKRTPKVCDSYNSDDADIDLISTDNVLLKAHSYRLQCASPIFRSMIDMAKSPSQRDPITLMDKSIEHSKVINLALDIIYTLNISRDVIQADGDSVKYLTDFAKKWDISMILDIIRKELSREIDSKTEISMMFEQFLVALHLGHNALAARYYACSDRVFWESQLHLVKDSADKKDTSATETDIEEGEEDGGDKDGSEEKGADSSEHYLSDIWAKGLVYKHELVASPGGDVLDLNIIPYDEFLRIPPTVVWIILRAQARDEATGESAEKTMKTLLDLAYPPPKSAKSSKKRKAEE